MSANLLIFATKEGKALLNKIDSMTESDETNVNESYISLRKYCYETLLNNESFETSMKLIGLNRCQLQNGKTLWYKISDKI